MIDSLNMSKQTFFIVLIAFISVTTFGQSVKFEPFDFESSNGEIIKPERGGFHCSR